MSTTLQTDERGYVEVNERHSDGIQVRLLQHEATGVLLLQVGDLRKQDTDFEAFVSPDEALHAFRHPYSYGARSDVRRLPVGGPSIPLPAADRPPETDDDEPSIYDHDDEA